jgi:uncharacterized membrane protein
MTLLFLTLRAAHVLIGAIWIGAVFMTSLFVMPALRDAGPGAAPVMAGLMRRKIHVFMASIGGFTVLTGMYLYYRFTGGFDPALSGTRAAMVFGTGGIAGFLALIVGGAVVSRSAKKMAALAERLPSAPEGERAKLAADMAAARSRAASASIVVLVLQVIAIVLMAIGHYV